MHRDHLGNIVARTNGAASVVSSADFDPFGRQRGVLWDRDATSSELDDLAEYEDSFTARGYTDHEMLNRTGFVHMNGRVFDPRLGRFIQPDPIIGRPTNSQNYNRYAYVFNSPLSATDPSGFDCGGGTNDDAGCDLFEDLKDLYENGSRVSLYDTSSSVGFFGRILNGLDSLNSLYYCSQVTANPLYCLGGGGPFGGVPGGSGAGNCFVASCGESGGLILNIDDQSSDEMADPEDLSEGQLIWGVAVDRAVILNAIDAAYDDVLARKRIAGRNETSGVVVKGTPFGGLTIGSASIDVIKGAEAGGGGHGLQQESIKDATAIVFSLPSLNMSRIGLSVYRSEIWMNVSRQKGGIPVFVYSPRDRRIMLFESGQSPVELVRSIE